MESEITTTRFLLHKALIPVIYRSQQQKGLFWSSSVFMPRNHVSNLWLQKTIMLIGASQQSSDSAGWEQCKQTSSKQTQTHWRFLHKGNECTTYGPEVHILWDMIILYKTKKQHLELYGTLKLSIKKNFHCRFSRLLKKSPAPYCNYCCGHTSDLKLHNLTSVHTVSWCVAMSVFD